MSFNIYIFPHILFGCLLLSSLLSTVDSNALEVEDESPFSYDLGAENGPQNWGNLHPNWTLCATGQSQSPANIVDYTVINRSSFGDLRVDYKPAQARIRNKGHSIEVEWTGDAGGIFIKGSGFKLLQCHWHIPSEHTLNGVRFNMEQHIVHNNSAGDIAVIGILYKIGWPDYFLSRITPYLKSTNREGTNIGTVDPRSINFAAKPEYYRYNGSLTTPPCSENITWTIFKMVRTASAQQIRALRDAVNDGNTGNARPIQALNGRPVYLLQPRHFL
ncbi:Alpha carbonic anhydrase 4 [Striga hermonthica]|uniref:Alpha carbonic anhydrase 4 n=1 Tax=Striga hermonthica TaxID=68872 RepID=A0A9N7R583_STRHE|nr:Alpha carbonic anhydrase 4 [Striga hermonthica]